MRTTNYCKAISALNLFFLIGYILPTYISAQKTTNKNTPQKTVQEFKPSDWILENLFGKVKSITTNVYRPEIEFGKIELKNPEEKIYTEFNLQGNILFSEENKFRPNSRFSENFDDDNADIPKSEWDIYPIIVSYKYS